MRSFQVIVSRVDGPLFAGDAVSISAPGSEGVVTILAGHEPFITALKAGMVTVRTAEGSSTDFPIHSGILEVTQKEAVVLL
jgi:F-type H+-transporting ATPase subunit epsilon